MKTTTTTTRTTRRTTNRSHGWATMTLLFCGLLGHANVIAVAATGPTTNNHDLSSSSSNIRKNGNGNGSGSGNGVISLKLTPRHTELDRRRRERERERNLVVDSETEGSYDGEDRYRRREEAVQVGALFEGYGTHYVDLWCGSPPQRQTVIVDTGSGITAFPCSGCRDCGVPDYHIDRLFVEEESSTFDETTCSNQGDCIMDRSVCNGNTCSVTMAYAEGSRWSAYEAVDRCYVAGPHETPLVSVLAESSDASSLEGDDMNPKHAADLAFGMTFGCQTVVTGLFKTQLADGIMGMSNQASTYWSQMHSAGKMGSDRQFALCFTRPPRITRDGTEAGAMTMGGVDQRLHLTPMVYTPRFDQGRRSFFNVYVRRMMLREGKYGESVQSTDVNPNKGVVVLDIDEGTLNRGGTIVDSGTTDTYFNSGINAEFSRVFLKITGRNHNNNPLNLSDEEFKQLPTILIQLASDDPTNSMHDVYKTTGLAGSIDPLHPSDVILAIPPSHYMEYNPSQNVYCSRFYPTERSGNVLGANAMMGHDVFFDMENNRIGWAESACDYTRTVQENGYDFEITGDLKPVEEVGGNGGAVDTTTTAAAAAENNNGDENKPCESISSGAKCQTIEGCTWGWGKCTKIGDSDNNNDNDNDTANTDTEEEATPADASATAAASEQQDRDPEPIEDDATETELAGSTTTTTSSNNLKQQLRDHPFVGIYSFIALSVLACCYCAFCRRSPVDLDQKYSRANLDSVSIELTTNGTGGSRNGSRSRRRNTSSSMGSSFQDESDSSDDDDSHDDDDGDDDEGDIVTCHGAPSSFRDEPEFEGDFA